MQHKSGYAQTKIVSEKLLQAAAHSLNLSVRVYRVASISGHSLTPFYNHHDWIIYLLRACVRAGCVVGETSVRLHWLPVDFVARCIVAYSRNHSTTGQVVNLVGDGMYF
jgi:thioester reductase-like protein